MEIRQRWIRQRLSHVSVADDFNDNLVLIQTKGQFRIRRNAERRSSACV